MIPSGVLLVNKPRGKTSFSLVAALRRKLQVKKIGHAGTLDPFATGVLVLLVGKEFTRMSDKLLCQDKEYLAEVRLGVSTDTYDCDGQVVSQSDEIPTLQQIESALSHFQGDVEQMPPMFSAKKINGKKLYELARQGKVVERQLVKIHLKTTLLSYEYPHLLLRISCSKGTYIRSIAYDLGQMLGCGAHLSNLTRERSGQFHLQDCLDGELLFAPETESSAITQHLLTN